MLGNFFIKNRKFNASILECLKGSYMIGYEVMPKHQRIKKNRKDRNKKHF